MVPRPLTPPLLRAPTAKEKKYDRQLRLWATSGQQALEDAHVLLFNGGGPGVVGVETLKNLILPGIGSYTIVDDTIVAVKDLGINFFLTDDSLGKSRAHETCKYLNELNPDVKGYPVENSLLQFLSKSGHEIPNQYSLVLFVASEQNTVLLGSLSKYCASKALPFFYVHSLGLFSYFSLQLPDVFPIVDTHPDPTSTQDLRLLDPWPELRAFTQSKTENLDTLSDHDHGHVPYLLLLLRIVDEWKESHAGSSPTQYKDKKEVKSLVESKARTSNPEGREENFDEAAGAVLKSLNVPTLPSGLGQIFNEASCKEPQRDSANFWLVANAIQQFHNTHDSLPLPGALPDMKAQSQDYIELQNIYKAKARQDVDEVTKFVRSMEADLQRQTPVERKEIEAFCKGAAFAKLIKGQPPLAIFPRTISEARKTSLWSLLTEEESLMPIYLAFLIYDTRVQLDQLPLKDYPVSTEISERVKIHARTMMLSFVPKSANQEDQDAVEESVQKLLTRMEPILDEFFRADGAELHNISALTGGMVAQEIIKVLTKQYIPIDNTCVFDGITSTSAVFPI
ncbi:MAG: hypothetical protein Q9182_003464 [Xanthomendoza sp. 2 TL-2023]